MKRRNPIRWTPATDAQLADLASQGFTRAEIGRRMDRNISAISTRLAKLGLDATRYFIVHTWLPEHDAFLVEHYPHQQTRDVADAVGLSPSAIYARARQLGLRKSDEFLASASSGRIQKGDLRSAAVRFRPGHTPWHAGQKGVSGSHPNSQKNWFTPATRRGADNVRYVPIGTERVNKTNGLLARKISDDPALSGGARWKSVHSLVWEAAHGPIPPGHVCVFRPGMATAISDEITVDRLEMISMRESMLRNSIHTRYPELAPIIQLRSALNRTIKNRTKK